MILIELKLLGGGKSFENRNFLDTRMAVPWGLDSGQFIRKKEKGIVSIVNRVSHRRIIFD